MAFPLNPAQQHWLYKLLGIHAVPCAREHGGAWGWGDTRDFLRDSGNIPCLYCFCCSTSRYFRMDVRNDSRIICQIARPAGTSREVQDAIIARDKEGLELLFIKKVLSECPELHGLVRIDVYAERLSCHERTEDLLTWRDFMEANVPGWKLPPEFQ